MICPLHNLSLPQKASITFSNNRVVVAGAAIYANDMSRCRWLGPNLPNNFTIFEIPPNEGSPFLFEENTLMRNVSTARGITSNEALATDPSSISAESDVSEATMCQQSLCKLKIFYRHLP